jgi:nicotinamide riboside kinase
MLIVLIYLSWHVYIMTIIVNLLGAPGSGKSTVATGVFHYLKLANVNVEYCPEVAKDLTWEGRLKALNCQPYVFGKQLRNMERLYDQVDVIVTDSPIILCRFYGMKYRSGNYVASFFDFVADQFRSMPGINFLLKRVKPYNPSGRNQTEDESDQIGEEMQAMLDDLGISYEELPGDEAAALIIAQQIKAALGKNYIAPVAGLT